MKSVLSTLLLLLTCFQLLGQNTDSTVIGKLSHYSLMINNFLQNIPQEKVYLHFDNTSYYQGDNIWFKCYVVNAGLCQETELSKTLYVELLNPGGEIIDKRILKVENGQCHGDFTLNRLPFYSGFYEVRAYTKYMLNFGNDVIFSRLLPVFDQPKTEGDFEDKHMAKYGSGNYPMKREKLRKEKEVNFKFFPEGGNLLQGVASRVAFEATDAFGNPIKLTGVIVTDTNEETIQFSSEHEGRGVFTYTPSNNKSKQKVLVEHEGKKYNFNLPDALLQGYVLTVDNLSYADSINITLQKNNNTPSNTLGVAVISAGSPYGFYAVDIADDEPTDFKISKNNLPSGVSWIVLFNSEGEILCDRLVFTNKQDALTINYKTGKREYSPYDRVDMEFDITDKNARPVQTTFSLAIRDKMNEVEYGRNILTDFLLMSEIKGYVRNPSYYFEADDYARRSELDQLLMVQGWRRYSWEQITGLAPFEIKYYPEQNIEVHGKVVSFMRGIPKPDVTVSSFLVKNDEDTTLNRFADYFVTDKLGRFAFRLDVEGRWNMILSVATEKGKQKDHRIILDRPIDLQPRKYQYTEMLLPITGIKDEANEKTYEQITKEDDIDSFFQFFEDSLAQADNKEKVYQTQNVTVVVDKKKRENDIYNNRSKSIAYYDISSELDDIKDRGEYVGNNIHELLLSIDKNFHFLNKEYLGYKGKMPIIAINHTPVSLNDYRGQIYKQVNVNAIKSIYINENSSTVFKYTDFGPKWTRKQAMKGFSCVVFIETYPEGEIPAKEGKGVRKTVLEGYSQVKEFYKPDYSVFPPDPDYRRTLYWNPSVTTDQDGKAIIHFYNNGTCQKFSISAETITSQGGIGVLRE